MTCLVLTLAFCLLLVNLYIRNNPIQSAGKPAVKEDKPVKEDQGFICRADVLKNHRRFNAKLYRSSTDRFLKYKETGPVQDFTRPSGHPLLGPGPDQAPMRRVVIPQEPIVSRNLPSYTGWLTKQNVENLNPADRANLRIIARGGRLIPQDIPAYHSPPVNGEQGWELLVNTEHLAQPQYVGYLPSNFTEADEKQRSMLNLQEINPNERLWAWELTHYPNEQKGAEKVRVLQ